MDYDGTAEVTVAINQKFLLSIRKHHKANLHKMMQYQCVK